MRNFKEIGQKISEDFRAILFGSAVTHHYYKHKLVSDLDFFMATEWNTEKQKLAEDMGLSVRETKVRADRAITVTPCAYKGTTVDFVFEHSDKIREDIFMTANILDIGGVKIPAISEENQMFVELRCAKLRNRDVSHFRNANVNFDRVKQKLLSFGESDSVIDLINRSGH